MAYYSRSSLAYDFTLFEEDPDYFRITAQSDDKADLSGNTDEGTIENRREDRRTRSREKAKRSRRRRSHFGRIAVAVIFGIAVAFVVVAIIHGQVQLTELNQEIADAKAQLAEQQSIYTQLEMKVDSSISTTVVEDYAKNDLNMSKATNQQKEFVDLSDGDKAEVSLSQDKNIFESIAEAFTSLWS